MLVYIQTDVVLFLFFFSSYFEKSIHINSLLLPFVSFRDY